MRLREIQKKIVASVDGLFLNSEQLSGSNPPQYAINNVINANKSIHALSDIGLFESEMSKLRLTSFYNNPNDSIRVNKEEFQNITGGVATIKKNAALLLEALNNSLHSESLDSEKSLSIKITSLKSFDDLILIGEKLKKTIQLPLSEFSDGGEIEIVNFDSGTFWLDIILPTAASVTLIGSVAWAGAVIYKKYKEAFAFNAYAEGLAIQKEHLQDLKDAAKKKIDLDIEAEAKLIQNEFFLTEDNEQLNRLKLSIKEYSELIQKGVQIQPALAAPEKITNLFPNYKAMELIESKIKHLPEAS
jgi:hypothetical protein